MYHQSRGIFLKLIKYSDTSVIAKIFTEQFGVQGYLVKGYRSKRPTVSPGLFQPLSLLDLVVSHKEKSSLHHIREARSARLFRNIHNDMAKSAQLMFLNELLYKVLEENMSSKRLFEFVFDALSELDDAPEAAASFHILFALNMIHFLGFHPQGEYSELTPVLDMAEGTFIPDPALQSPYLLEGDACQYFSRGLQTPVSEHAEFKVPKALREELLEKVLQYYQLHLPGVGEFKSHLVLKEVFR